MGGDSSQTECELKLIEVILNISKKILPTSFI